MFLNLARLRCYLKTWKSRHISENIIEKNIGEKIMAENNYTCFIIFNNTKLIKPKVIFVKGIIVKVIIIIL
jgi:hypothetical protein